MSNCGIYSTVDFGKGPVRIRCTETGMHTKHKCYVTIVFPGIEEEEGTLVKHARRELELVGNDANFNESIIKAVEGFASYGHSGGSASVAINILNDLLQFKNLTPLTNDPKEWMYVADEIWGEPGGIWQNRRNSEAFSNDGGKTYYLLSEGGHDRNRKPTHISESIDSRKTPGG